jgi:hypothetical protein
MLSPEWEVMVDSRRRITVVMMNVDDGVRPVTTEW